MNPSIENTRESNEKHVVDNRIIVNGGRPHSMYLCSARLRSMTEETWRSANSPSQNGTRYNPPSSLNLCKWTVRFVHLRFQLCHPRLTSTDWSNEGLWSTRGAWEWRELVCVLGDSLTVSAAAADNHLHWETPASLNITGHNSHY